ncbi:hypothetical protein R3Q06_28970 [Rhodococcus erythropolis]|uniref:hypothetical protein n=1 Tax=Rhodococcus erythropolis TaxID=1833 RepID=UPI0029499CFB|nr:hypothetical protein [Rhodococcus erythropolis]MDV6277528.1 hypothetical protein [Rhodococcus erythropolis]
MQSLPRLSKASVQLADAAQIVIDALGNSSMPAPDVQAILKSRIKIDDLAAAVRVVGEVVGTSGGDDAVESEMLRRFATLRAVVPTLAAAAPFGATSGGAQVLAAFHALPEVLSQRRLRHDQIAGDVLSPSWRRLVGEGAHLDR